MNQAVVAIIQARLGSSRLPGKVLLDIGGEPMLQRVVTRTARARSVASLLVATTTENADDQIVAYCGAHGIECTRGSQFDVLDRYYQAASAAHAGIVVRITADCPVIDPSLIDDAVRTLMDPHDAEGGSTQTSPMARLSFVTNRLPPPWRRTYPIGLDTEVCTFEALSKACHEAVEPRQREHVMPYLYEGVEFGPSRDGVAFGVTPRGFRIALLDCGMELGHYRWTVDTPEDLEFMRRVYNHFEGRDEFSWIDVLALVSEQPELMEINAGVRHKTLGDVDERAPRPGEP